MRSKIVLLAALLAATLALPSQARAPEHRTGWLILAQSDGQATCELDGRRVPQGTSLCRDGYVSTCSRSGRWDRTSKRC